MMLLPCWKTRDTVHWMRGLVPASAIKLYYIDGYGSSGWAIYGELWDRTRVRLSDGRPSALDAEKDLYSIARSAVDDVTCTDPTHQ